MLLITSLLGSLVGFFVCHRLINAKVQRIPTHIQMRLCMGNSMALAFIFAMLIEIATGSKFLGATVSLVAISISIYLTYGPNKALDIIESVLSAIMGVAMGVMLLGMMSATTVWVLQLGILGVEILFLLVIQGKLRWN